MMAGRGPRGAAPDAKDAGEWFAGRLPEGWFDGPPSVTVDREEIVVVGALPSGDEESVAQREGRAARFGRRRASSGCGSPTRRRIGTGGASPGA